MARIRIGILVGTLTGVWRLGAPRGERKEKNKNKDQIPLVACGHDELPQTRNTQGTIFFTASVGPFRAVFQNTKLSKHLRG